MRRHQLVADLRGIFWVFQDWLQKFLLQAEYGQHPLALLRLMSGLGLALAAVVHRETVGVDSTDPLAAADLAAMVATEGAVPVLY
jgi:hypothetical protein